MANLKLKANCGCGIIFILEDPRQTVPFMKSVVSHCKNYHHTMEFIGSIQKTPRTKQTVGVVSQSIH